MRIELRVMRTLLISLVVCQTANAGTLDSDNSHLEVKVGSIPTYRVNANSGAISLTGNPVHVVEQAGVFQINNHPIERAAFIGNQNLTGFNLDMQAGAGDYSAGASYVNPIGTGTVTGVGGLGTMSGLSVLQMFGFNIRVPTLPIGIGGINLAVVLNNDLVLTGAPFNTGEAKITGITTPVFFVPSLGITGAAFTLHLTTVRLMTATPLTGAGNAVELNTVTVRGSNDLTPASQNGVIKMISPFRINTESLKKPGVITKTFTFVPEPGTVLQLVTGSVVLAAIGRRRIR